MNFTEKSLAQVMHMAGLRLLPHEKKSLHKELQKMITWIEKLDEVDAAGTAPLTTLSP